MTEEVKIMYCHKDLTQQCKQEACPMWFTPPNPKATGDCAECLVVKQQFWDIIKRISDEMIEEQTPETP